MKIFENRTETIQVCADVICNRCGESCKNGFSDIEYAHVEHDGGFGSKFPGDQAVVEFDLCEKCLRKFCDELKIPANIRWVEL